MEIIPDNNEEKKQPDPQEEEKSVDEAWADSLGLKYDAEEAARRATPPPYNPQTPPPYQSGNAPTPQTPPPAFNNPAVPPYQESEPMPKTYMLWSILSVVFCCFIPGIVAIIYSAQVSSKYYAKDYEGAKHASERAQAWIIAAIVLGVISAAFYLPLTLLG